MMDAPEEPDAPLTAVERRTLAHLRTLGGQTDVDTLTTLTGAPEVDVTAALLALAQRGLVHQRVYHERFGLFGLTARSVRWAAAVPV